MLVSWWDTSAADWLKFDFPVSGFWFLSYTTFWKFSYLFLDFCLICSDVTNEFKCLIFFNIGWSIQTSCQLVLWFFPSLIAHFLFLFLFCVPSFFLFCFLVLLTSIRPQCWDTNRTAQFSKWWWLLTIRRFSVYRFLILWSQMFLFLKLTKGWKLTAAPQVYPSQKQHFKNHPPQHRIRPFLERPAFFCQIFLLVSVSGAFKRPHGGRSQARVRGFWSENKQFFSFRGGKKEDENSNNEQKPKTESVQGALVSIPLNSLTFVQEVFWLCSRFLSFSRVLSIVLEVG